MTTFMPIVRDVLFFVICVGLPIAVFFPRIKKPAGIGKRMVIGVFGTWAALILHHELVAQPVAFALAKARGDIQYDGVGMNAVIYLVGWVPSVIATAIVASAYMVIQYVRKKRKTA